MKGASPRPSLDDYVKIRSVGRGSFGEAILVRHRVTRQECVLKRVKLDDLSADKAEEAIREGELLSQLRHPYIVEFLGSFVDTRRREFCLLTAFCELGDLRERLARVRAQGAHGGLKEKRIMSWLWQLASALEFIHARFVLHRDLKPSNVFLTATASADGEESLAIGDFGVSRMLCAEHDMAMTAVGTPCYLSPEVCRGKPYSYKSDIWALGCVLYEMAALRPAFDPRCGSLERLVGQIVQARYANSALLVAKYPSTMTKVQAMLKVAPQLRPSAAEVVTSCGITKASVGTAKVERMCSRETLSTAVVEGCTGGSGGDHSPPRQDRILSPFPALSARAAAALAPAAARASLAAQILEAEHLRRGGWSAAMCGSQAPDPCASRVALAKRILEAEAQQRIVASVLRDGLDANLPGSPPRPPGDRWTKVSDGFEPPKRVDDLVLRDDGPHLLGADAIVWPPPLPAPPAGCGEKVLLARQMSGDESGPKIESSDASSESRSPTPVDFGGHSFVPNQTCLAKVHQANSIPKDRSSECSSVEDANLDPMIPTSVFRVSVSESPQPASANNHVRRMTPQEFERACRREKREKQRRDFRVWMQEQKRASRLHQPDPTDVKVQGVSQITAAIASIDSEVGGIGRVSVDFAEQSSDARRRLLPSASALVRFAQESPGVGGDGDEVEYGESPRVGIAPREDSLCNVRAASAQFSLGEEIELLRESLEHEMGTQRLKVLYHSIEERPQGLDVKECSWADEAVARLVAYDQRYFG